MLKKNKWQFEKGDSRTEIRMRLILGEAHVKTMPEAESWRTGQKVDIFERRG